MKITRPNVVLTPQAIVVLIGFIIVISASVYALIINNEPIEYPRPKTIPAHHEVDKIIGNDVYVFSFDYRTNDVFAANNPIDVMVTAELPNAKANWTILRFQGASRHVDWDPALSNEINMTRMHDYSFQGKGKLLYGLGGKWGAWLTHHKPNQTYGDPIEDVIEIAPSDSLLQVEIGRQSLVLAKSQDKLNRMMVALTIAALGVGIAQLAQYPPLKQKPRDIKIS